jgi:hypothetical protein
LDFLSAGGQDNEMALINFEFTNFCIFFVRPQNRWVVVNLKRECHGVVIPPAISVSVGLESSVQRKGSSPRLPEKRRAEQKSGKQESSCDLHARSFVASSFQKAMLGPKNRQGNCVIRNQAPLLFYVR